MRKIRMLQKDLMVSVRISLISHIRFLSLSHYGFSSYSEIPPEPSRTFFHELMIGIRIKLDVIRSH